MAEPVVVICSPGEEAAARSLCAAVESRGAGCWSPVRSPREASESAVDGHIRNAVALVVLTRNALQHRREVELARQHSVKVVIASSDDATDAWQGTLAELHLAGVLDTAETGARAAQYRTPRVYAADDEERHIEFIAENVSEAQVFVRFGLFDKAIGRLQAVLGRVPRNLEAHDELLKIYLEENEHDEAAASAADYLDSLLFRGEEQSYSMLRSHLLEHGFAVDDGPPVSVGAAGGVFRTTRFYAMEAPVDAPGEVPPQPHLTRSAGAPASGLPKSASLAPEPLPLDLPILRNFRPSQPALEAHGIESDLSGIDFLFDHGLLDEARMRIDQLARDWPDHPGVTERQKRLEVVVGPRPGVALSLSLDEDWGVPTAAVRTPRPESVAVPATVPTEAPAIVPPKAPAGPAAELVCSVFCALAIDEGDTFDIRAWIHATSETEANGVALIEDRREAAVLSSRVSVGDALTVSLSLPTLEIEGSASRATAWGGAATSSSFRVTAPMGTAESFVEGWLTIERDGEQIGEVPLKIRIA